MKRIFLVNRSSSLLFGAVILNGMALNSAAAAVNRTDVLAIDPGTSSGQITEFEILPETNVLIVLVPGRVLSTGGGTPTEVGGVSSVELGTGQSFAPLPFKANGAANDLYIDGFVLTNPVASTTSISVTMNDTAALGTEAVVYSLAGASTDLSSYEIFGEQFGRPDYAPFRDMGVTFDSVSPGSLVLDAMSSRNADFFGGGGVFPSRDPRTGVPLSINRTVPNQNSGPRWRASFSSYIEDPSSSISVGGFTRSLSGTDSIYAAVVIPPVPEPMSLALLGLGGLTLLRRSSREC